jgi:leucyl/phenylalanyl-tRNA--protein transferase
MENKTYKDYKDSEISTELILLGYSQGLFPMADENGLIEWHSPNPRAIFPLYDLKMPRSLRKLIEKERFHFTMNECFEEVIKNCANRQETWISEDIIELYTELHHQNFAYSIETWKDGKLVGGLYGISIMKAFFGESMFSLESGASKAAFYYLVDILKANKILLFDTQYLNEHTEKLGAIEISRSKYHQLLKEAMKVSYEL